MGRGLSSTIDHVGRDASSVLGCTDAQIEGYMRLQVEALLQTEVFPQVEAVLQTEVVPQVKMLLICFRWSSLLVGL